MAKGFKTGGRQPGSKNKVPADLRKLVAESLDQLGGIDYLVELGKKHPQAYSSLLGKVIPKEIEAKVTGTITMIDEFAGQ